MNETESIGTLTVVTCFLGFQRRPLQHCHLEKPGEMNIHEENSWISLHQVILYNLYIVVF